MVNPAWSRSLPPVVQQAIQEFTPCRKPPPRELRGLTVAIDPAGGNAADPEARASHDLSLLTAAHLHQLIALAGGTAVLTRLDDSQRAGSSPSSVGRRIQLVHESGCALCVSIRYAGTAQGATVHAVHGSGAEADQPGACLAECLRSALNADVIELDKCPSGDSEFLRAFDAAGAPGSIQVCEVLFGGPHPVSPLAAQSRIRCLENASRLYEGIKRFHIENQSTPGRGTVRTRDAPDAREPILLHDVSTAETSAERRRLGRFIWPDGRLPSERVEWFCRMFGRLAVTARSLVYFDVSASVREDVVILGGKTNAPPLSETLEDALRGVGIEQIRNEIRTLPDEGRLGKHMFGVCRVASALTTDRPDNGGGAQTQLLFGEPVFLLDRTDDHCLLHAGDGYWGWVRREAVQSMKADEFDEWMRHPRGIVLADVEVGPVRIPRGSIVALASTESNGRVLLLPDRSQLTVPASVITTNDSESAKSSGRARAALELLYIPYVFGGRSPAELDCSGLVANVWAITGHHVARDAWQQALAGSLVATRWRREGIRAGDQLFFIGPTGQIDHTGVAIDATHVVHAAPPYVQIGSLNPGDRLYDPRLDREFFMAKRT
ncbi:MAG: C40 family peptidase [Planctomycetota bacterium]